MSIYYNLFLTIVFYENRPQPVDFRSYRSCPRWFYIRIRVPADQITIRYWQLCLYFTAVTRTGQNVLDRLLWSLRVDFGGLMIPCWIIKTSNIYRFRFFYYTDGLTAIILTLT